MRKNGYSNLSGSNILQYGNYYGTVEFDLKERRIYGRILGLNDKISYEGTDLDSLERDFREAVNDYVNFCNEIGKEPEKSFSGKILLRVDPELHGQVAAAAQRSGMSINAWLNEALRASVAEPPRFRS